MSNEQGKLPEVAELAVENLQVGDKVDLNSCPFLKERASADFEYAVVESVERETPECVAVSYQDHGVVGYPIGCKLKLSSETLADRKLPETVDGIRESLASLVELDVASGEPVFQRNLAGYAGQAAAKELIENWDEALRSDPNGKIVGNLIGDVDDTIAALKVFRDRALAVLPELHQAGATGNLPELEAFLRTTQADQGGEATFEKWVRATATDDQGFGHSEAVEYLRLGGDLRDKDLGADGQWKLAGGQPSYLDYVKGLPLQEALWWFIENGHDELEGRSEIFFALRERVRTADIQAAQSASAARRIAGLVLEGDHEGVLDSVVHDECSAFATGVNNDGAEAQVKYLLVNGWTEAMILKEAGVDTTSTAPSPCP